MNDFLEKPIGQLYARFLPSAVISLLISTVASLIDTVVVSFYMGPVALSAVNICMPIYSILSAVGLLVVGGASTLYSQYMGKNKKLNADKVFTLAAVVLVIIGIAYTIVGVCFTDQVVRFLGANDAVFDMSRQYAKVLFCFVLVNILFPLLQSFIRIDMDPSRTVFAIVICALTNLFLDILLIGPFLSPNGFGTTGAAYATCIAYCVAFVVLLLHFGKKSNTLHFVKDYYNGNECKRMIIAGIPASITLFGQAITMTIFNNFIITRGNGYGAGIGELYVSVYSVIVQVMSISMAVYVGIAQCAQPIFAANYGAEKYDRIKELFKKGLIIEVVGNAILMVVLFLLADKIAVAFSMDKGAYDMTSTAVLAIRVFSLSLIITGINQMFLYLFQTADEVVISSIISLLAGTVLLIVGLYLLAGLALKGNPDGLGVWLSFLFAQAGTFIYAFYMYMKKKDKIFGLK